MWIIPKPLHTSLSAPATEALISDSQELSEQCAQSLLVRSKPSPVRTWSQKWKRDSWTSHLSGRILKPSRGSSFAAQWTSSLEASLVSLSAPQDDAQETMTQDTFGHTSSEASNSLDDLPLFSLRTSKASSQADSAETIGATGQERPFCSMSSESWSAWVMTQRQAYSVRVKSAPPINASASLFSEQTSTAQGETSSTDCSTTWPTPKALEVDESVEQHHTRALKKSAKNRGPSLTVAAKMASQPTLHQEASSSTSGSHQESLWMETDRSSTTAPMSSDSSETVSYQTQPQGPSPSCGESYVGKLNPRWVETLMGLPVGWVRPSADDNEND